MTTDFWLPPARATGMMPRASIDIDSFILSSSMCGDDRLDILTEGWKMAKESRVMKCIA